MAGELVLVTGGTGFIAAHCIVRLLEHGFRVRTTVRSLARADEVRQLVRAGGADASAVRFAQLDLLHDDGWDEAAAGARYVLHVASPFPVRQPKDADELIVPAREGALRALRAARAAGARRVVLTSSFAAVGYSSRPGRPYTEEDWTDPDDPSLSPYIRSKAAAERAAWDFVEREGEGLELATVNPVAVFGPALGPDLSSSLELLRTMLNGGVPALPRAAVNAVDVRDVADLHVRAMTHPDASGERFLAVAGDPVLVPEIARIVRAGLGDAARHVPRRVLPDWLVRVVARFDPQVRAVVPDLGHLPYASHAKAADVLGWTPRSNEESILAAAESLVRLGLVRE
ncbi:NAD-dependent epimerase/dehydratase family protein [Agromyces sp. MMS24-K17]|uniref:NAD-dependent epimerase/dehydratase family protein n=1 Tax=Agromyces sp. MMS24-K17 TaxID=3372850 RepID=UPI003754510D